jgi:hypothetical protein
MIISVRRKRTRIATISATHYRIQLRWKKHKLHSNTGATTVF